MNRIYKTIRNALTGKTAVASEHAKRAGQPSSTACAVRAPGAASFAAIAVVAAIASTTLCTSALAQTIVYDGTGGPGTAQLESEGAIGTGLPKWLGLVSAAQGLIYRDSSGSATVLTGADLQINYTPTATNIPQFVIGGYSANSGEEVKDNTVTLTQGEVNSPVFGGLSHKTLITADAFANTGVKIPNSTAKANNNSVDVQSSNSPVTGAVYGGNATVWAQAGKATAGTAKATAYAYANYATVTASSNSVTVGAATVSGGLYGGHASLAAQASEATAADATANATANANATAYAYGYADTDAYSSTVSASSNSVTVGAATVSGGLYGGHASLAAQSGKPTAANAYATATATATATAYANASVIASNVTVTANSNSVTVGAATVSGGLYGGHASLAAQAGEATAGTANAIATTAKAYAYAYASVTTNSSTVSASSNSVTVGTRATVDGNMAGGYAGLSVAGGTATGGTIKINNGSSSYGDASARVNVSNTKVSANHNTVTFDGVLQNGNIYGGMVAFEITKGTAIKADNSAGEVSVDLNGTVAQATGNTVTLGENAIISNSASSLYGGGGWHITQVMHLRASMSLRAIR